MNIKEKLSTVTTGKPLMSAFFASELIDVAMTKMDLALYHGTEANLLGPAELMKTVGEQDIFILKIALSALLVGAYALASISKKQFRVLSSNIRTDHVTERALQGATIFMAGVLTWDAIELGWDVIANIRL